MSFMFPVTPTVGQTVIGPTGVPYTWDGEKWVTSSTGSALLFLPTSGGTMTGPVALAGDATQALQPTTLQQVNGDVATLQTQITANNNTIWGTGGLAGGFVNKIRNPGMDVWLRAFSTNVLANNNSYTTDGWIVQTVGAACSVSLGGKVGLSTYSLTLAAATGLTTLYLIQRIESGIIAPLVGQRCTFQAKIKNNTSAPITLQLQTAYPSTADVWPTASVDISAVNLQSVPVGNTVTVAYTFTMSTSATTGYGIFLVFNNVLNATVGSVQVTDVDLRATPGVLVGLNANPPPVEFRVFPIELSFCQRYYQNIVMSARWYSYSANETFSVPVFYNTPMRVSPTSTLLSVDQTSNALTRAFAAGAIAGRFELVSGGVGDTYNLGCLYSLSAEL